MIDIKNLEKIIGTSLILYLKAVNQNSSANIFKAWYLEYEIVLDFNEFGPQNRPNLNCY